MTRALRQINAVLEKLTAVSSSAIAAIMVLALTLSAITRYVSGTGYDWFIELPPALVPWMVFPLLGLLRNICTIMKPPNRKPYLLLIIMN